ncbi:arrestin [Colletotrichum musicola]|uniref:Arrestin n=1 Tax=Colletotrichum musicola TaxID=2175873 RepID=A0A8H6K4X4_9PEZI|nr:arrestin [Colletotrichum musicola]
MSLTSFVSLLFPSLLRRNSAEIEIKLDSHHDDKIYGPGRQFTESHTYKIPFSFVIPKHLTLSACKHENQSRAAFDQHMRLPSFMGYWSKDDLSPEGARVEYIIKVHVARGPPRPSGSLEKPMLAKHLINVLPDPVEDPPLHIALQDERYTLNRSKTLRKNIFSAKQGLLTVLATQPSSIRLIPDGNTVSESALIISLQFDPISPETAPPSVRNIIGIIMATTWLSGIPMHTMPDLSDQQSSSVFPINRGFSVPIPLVFPDLKGAASWTTVPEQEFGGNTALHYEATLRVPFEIPTQPNMILPTFHTCHISRTYTLALTVKVANAKFYLDIPV